MASAGPRDGSPAEPLKQIHSLDPRVAEAYDRVRRRRNIGLAVILPMTLGLVLWTSAILVPPYLFPTPTPSWVAWALAAYVIVYVAVFAATAQGVRCPSCHRPLGRPFFLPGTDFQLCRRCGVRLR